MKKLFKIIVLITIITIITSCNKHRVEKHWTLIGSDISLLLDLENKVIKLSERDKLIFELSVLEHRFDTDEKINVKATFKKIGNKNEYKLKYGNMKEFIVWFELDKNDPTLMKMIFGKYYKNPYYFSTKKTNMLQTKYRFLRNYEIQSFLSSIGIKNVTKDHNLEIITSKKPIMTNKDVLKKEKTQFRIWYKKQNDIPNIPINRMIDYITDMDPSTFWATKNYWNTEFEFLIKDSFGKKMKKPVKIIGFYFNTGNLDKKQKYYQYHRLKEIEIFLSKEYGGSLGSSQANYNYVNYKLVLPDTQEEKMIVFFEPIKANSIRLKFNDYYMGYENALALYDIAIFVDSD